MPGTPEVLALVMRISIRYFAAGMERLKVHGDRAREREGWKEKKGR